MTHGDKERLGAKFDNDVAQDFREFCNNRGESISSVLRRLVLTELARHSYLEEDRRKALGVVPDG